MKTLPQFLVNMLNTPPSAGNGVNSWLFSTAIQLHHHYDQPTIVEMLQERTRDCGRIVPQREIERAVRNSARCAWRPTHGASKPISSPRRVCATAPPCRPWPMWDNKLQAEVLRKYAPFSGLAELLERSDPRPMDDPSNETESIIDVLFPGNPWVCCGNPYRYCGEKKLNSETRRREDWRGELGNKSLVVPSPMRKKSGLTQDGNESERTLDNVGQRRFLVVEFDRHSIDDQSAFHLHLSELCPLVCVVHSGGKSLHGWYYVHGQPESEVRKFFEYAVRLGADPATWNRVQFVRMPGGVRNGGWDKPDKPQTIYYLNFNALNNEL
ncbi:hypothetical protein OAK15_01000 [Verrucomicrobia bacterium]|nr:hypothetical protein [Verrucomicrobiota bacterium]